ncbi:SHC-transforming-like protein 1 [Armadillidium nasatum]|uniref:SHC-transforming-like protein 1 n=1 Tax=Armadillidium nasatum TaxID=96803 RepID=A0A5N5T4L3_9CRUS|nr:SHC-transforming-like protein 1 [Armadillidium nasatum]
MMSCHKRKTICGMLFKWSSVIKILKKALSKRLIFEHAIIKTPQNIVKSNKKNNKRVFVSIEPFSMQLTQLSSHTDSMSSNTTTTGTTTKPLPLAQRLELQREIWYHGPISRKEAESLLKQDGDFLVRESQGTVGQYVLTGIQNGIKKHLLLVNPEGVVRTKSRTFDSVSHLINYHRDNELPIVSAESALILRHPVPRSH